MGKAMGVFDGLSGIALLFYQLQWIPYNPLLGFGAYLLIKSAVTFGSLLGLIEGIIGIYMILTIVMKFPLVSYIFASYLILRGIWSWF